MRKQNNKVTKERKKTYVCNLDTFEVRETPMLNGCVVLTDNKDDS